jgi:lipid A 3-O-deacylase
MMGNPGTPLWSWRKTPRVRPVRRLRATEAMLAVRCVCFFHLLIGLYTLATGLAGPAHAADTGWIDEVKLGVLAHDIRFLGNHVEPGADINVEVLFPSPAFLRLLWAPRPHLGLSINTAGATDYGYVGLTWSGRPWRPLLALPEGLFIAGSLGGGAHDGHRNAGPPDRKILGSRLLFRESVEAGYQLGRKLSLSIMLDHVSNAGLTTHNQGLTNLGARVGVAF